MKARRRKSKTRSRSSRYTTAMAPRSRFWRLPFTACVAFDKWTREFSSLSCGGGMFTRSRSPTRSSAGSSSRSRFRLSPFSKFRFGHAAVIGLGILEFRRGSCCEKKGRRVQRDMTQSIRVVGGKYPRPYWDRFDRLQASAELVRGGARPPKGVFRFKTWTEFNEWKMKYRMQAEIPPTSPDRTE